MLHWSHWSRVIQLLNQSSQSFNQDFLPQHCELSKVAAALYLSVPETIYHTLSRQQAQLKYKRDYIQGYCTMTKQSQANQSLSMDYHVVL